MSIIVVIDDREQRNHFFKEKLTQYFQRKNQLHEVIIKVKRLPIGDLALFRKDKAHVIELKQTSDFYQSIVDGRLFNQAGSSIGTTLYNHEISQFSLITYGDWKQSYKAYSSRVSSPETYWEWLDKNYSAVMTLAYRYGVKTWHVSDKTELVLFLARLITREKQGGNTRASSITVTPVKVSTQDPMLTILSVIPNVGYHKARLLLQYFATPIRTFLHPAPHKLIQGIGKTVTTSITTYIKAGDQIHWEETDKDGIHFTLKPKTPRTLLQEKHD